MILSWRAGLSTPTYLRQTTVATAAVTRNYRNHRGTWTEMLKLRLGVDKVQGLCLQPFLQTEQVLLMAKILRNHLENALSPCSPSSPQVLHAV